MKLWCVQYYHLIIDLSQCGPTLPLLILSKSHPSISPSSTHSSNYYIFQSTKIFYATQLSILLHFWQVTKLILFCLLSGVYFEKIIRTAHFFVVCLSWFLASNRYTLFFMSLPSNIEYWVTVILLFLNFELLKATLWDTLFLII
jgi:hypothetical protein